VARIVLAVLLLGTIVGSAAAGRGGQESPPPATGGDRADKSGKKDKKSKKEKLAEPWPSPEELKERQAAAESLPLFKGGEPLAITFTSEFKALKKDRVVESAKRFPGVLSLAGERGEPVSVPVEVGTRGRLRLNPKVCSFPPLRLQVSKQQAKGTLFEGQGSLKMVTHCQESGDFEQYLLGEALAYRIANLLTPDSFRIRVARVSYVESTTGKPVTTRWAILIEDDSDLARRMQGRVAPVTKQLFRNLDQPSLLRLAVFQTMIGNTDYSISALHNVRLVQDRDGVLRPVAYDFDSSGLVSPPYAAPDRRMGLQSVRDRRYRGPCLPVEQLEPTLAEFRARKAKILALYDAEAALTADRRREAKDYLNEFFDVIADQRRTKLLFVERCRPLAGM
jgi:hypothetical protein